MNKNLKIAIFSFLALGLVTATAVSAHQGPANANSDSINKANISNNYEDRAERMKSFHENLSEEELEKMSQMHELMINGEYEAAAEMHSELKIGPRHMNAGHMNARARGNMPGFVDKNNNGLCDNIENIELN